MTTPLLGEVRRFLLVDQDLGFARVLEKYLQSHGIEVITMRSAAAGAQHVSTHACNLVMVDPRHQDGAAERLLSTLNERGIPFIIASAERSEADRVIGLERGAEDYLVKPLALRELLARIHGIERRLQRGAATAVARPTAQFGGWTFQLPRVLTASDGHRVVLTPAEMSLLLALLEHPDEALSRDRIVELTHADTPSSSARTVDVLVARLRRKLGEEPRHPRIILTVRALGYQMGIPVLWGVPTDRVGVATLESR